MTVHHFVLVSLSLAMCLGCGSNKAAQFIPPREDVVEVPGNAKETPANSDDPVAIIRAAIEAHGGESNFAKANIGQTIMTIDGAIQPGISGRFTKTDSFHVPGKRKSTVKGEAQGQKLDMNTVINGDRAWMQMNGGEPTPLPVINPSQGVYPNANLAILLALKGPAFQLTVLPSDNINGRPVHRIRMETAGEWVGDSFFDKETHFLLASKKELFDNTIGKARAIETYYSAFKKVDGLTLPMSMEMIVDGQTTARIKVTEVKFLDEIDEDVFAKPVARK